MQYDLVHNLQLFENLSEQFVVISDTLLPFIVTLELFNLFDITGVKAAIIQLIVINVIISSIREKAKYLFFINAAKLPF